MAKWFVLQKGCRYRRSAFSRKNPPPCGPPWQGGTGWRREVSGRANGFVCRTGTEARRGSDGATERRSHEATKGRTKWVRFAEGRQLSAISFQPELTQPAHRRANGFVLQKGCPLSAISFSRKNPPPVVPLGKGDGRSLTLPVLAVSAKGHTGGRAASGTRAQMGCFALRPVSPQRDDGAGLSKERGARRADARRARHPYRSR